MKIFVTGATGFIGSNFIKSKKIKTHKIFCIKRNTSKQIYKYKNIKWINGGLDKKYSKIFKETDILVHFASHSTNPPYDNISNCLFWNVNAPLLLFENAINNGVKKFIVIGSGYEYGLSCLKHKKIPVNASLLPNSSYALSKAISSIVFEQWAKENKIKLKYIRLFHVYGEGESPKRFWPSLKKQALEGKDFYMTKGEQLRDFTHVDMVVEHVIKELNFMKVNPGKPIITNFGSGKTQSLKAFALKWWKYFGAEGKIYFGKIKYRKNEIMRFIPKL